MTQFVVSQDKGTAQSFALPLVKNESFKVTLSWDGKGDADLHALICSNNGSRSVISSWDDIFSTYNVKRMSGGQQVGHLDKAPNGTFSTYGGALIHSADALDGQQAGVDEFIDIYPDKLPARSGAIEIPLVAMVHGGMLFKNLQNVRVIISKMDGTVLMEASLSETFGDYNGVQMGSLIIDHNGPVFHSLGTCFNGDFNSVIAHFAP